MSLHRGLRFLAGFMVLLSLVLTFTVNRHFVWLTAFVGMNLLQSSLTDWCPAMPSCASWVSRNEKSLRNGPLRPVSEERCVLLGTHSAC